MAEEPIVRSDFPLVRRGYDPAAVDEHLSQVAKRLAGGVAPAVSGQVQSILAAAEQAAADIEREARERAAELDRGAADRTRQDASRVADATEALRGQIDAIEDELGALLGDLRSRLEAVGAAMAEFESGVGAAFAAEAEAVRPEPEPEPLPRTPPAAKPDGAAANGASTDVDQAIDDARLVALDMMLGGTDRAAVDAYLADHFPQLPNRGALLDEVEAVAGA